jgi:DNA-binding XRE family transcriptional regulator
MRVAKPKPSRRLRGFLKAYGSVHAAAMAWGVEYQALNRFLNGDCGLSLANAMQIAAVTKVSVDDLFEQQEKASKR